MKNLNKNHAPFNYDALRHNTFNVKREQHPARTEIRKCIGTYTIKATFDEDVRTTDMFGHINGLIAFICRLEVDGKVIGEGRGAAVLNSFNKYVERTVGTALKASLVDAVVRSTKILETLPMNPQPAPEKGRVRGEQRPDEQVPMADNPITDKQKSYLTELIHMNVEPNEQDQLLSQLDEMTKDEASEMIGSFVR
jgi:hypothetical protein